MRNYLFKCPATCPEGRHHCPNSHMCLRLDYFCDGDNDCYDWGDETDFELCGTSTPVFALLNY